MPRIQPAYLWGVVVAVGAFRLVSLGLYPLMDTTEARYGEIARIIVETGNWIVPQIDYGVPFWGKPPLSFWASAISIDWFRNSAFFMRLPHFLAALAVLPLTWRLAPAMGLTRYQASLALAILVTTIGFLITAGAVMTDMFLCLSMALVMVGFWLGWHGEKRYLLLMYAGIGMGLLTKGPVIVALAGIAIFPWLVIVHGPGRMWAPLLTRLNWLTGIALVAAIAVPWYYLMERTSPGFLQYFLVGEHWQRFVESGWQGDLYGSGHARPRGTIWLFWLAFSFPWSLLLIVAASRRLFAPRFDGPVVRDPAVLYLVLWMCSPMLLFTFAGNILPAYILPGLPATGLLVMKTFKPELAYRGRFLLLVGPALLLIVFVQLSLTADHNHSERALLQNGVKSDHDIYYFHRRPYSAQYYSNGKAQRVDEFPRQDAFYLVVRKRDLFDELERHCQLRATNLKRQLFFCTRDDLS